MNAHKRKLRGLLPLDGPAPRVHHVHHGFWRGTNTGYANTITPFSSHPTTLPRAAAAHHREVAATTTAGGLPSFRPTWSQEHATDAWYDSGPADGRPRAPLPPRWTSCRDLPRIAFPSHQIHLRPRNIDVNMRTRPIPPPNQGLRGRGTRPVPATEPTQVSQGDTPP